MLRIDALDAEPVLDPIPAAAPDAATLKTIDDIWQRERQKRGDALFDGKLFTLIARDGSRLRGALVNYRRFIAQREQPELFDVLRLRSLAVSGLLTGPDGIVFGQRNTATTQDGGRWELAPSGGIDADAATPRAALLRELHEELGCPADAVTAATAFALVEDESVHTIDIAYAIETALSAAALRQLYHRHGSGEYIAIEIVPRDALAAFLAAHDVIEVSHALLRLRGLV